MPEISADDVARFESLFRGNLRSFGRFFPGRKAPLTLKERVQSEDFQSHLNGGEKGNGVGIVPIRDDGNCYFGAIDIDAHGSAPDINLIDLERNIRDKDLPLTVCRSKSGGAHVYLFGSEPLNAQLVRNALTKWAAMLGYPGVEIFPKQSNLPKDETGRRQLGNWLNLCYHDAVNGSPLRYGVEAGKKITLSYFLEIAENRRITGSMLVEKSEDDHGGAPPCVQKIISDGVKAGHRNEALYNVCIYLKQAYPETWKDKAFDLNSRMFDAPLIHTEAKKTIHSAGRRQYRYKCGEEPCRSRCKSDICVDRKFGITGEEKTELRFGKDPEFTGLTKILTSPVKWDLMIDGGAVTLTTEQLMSFRLIRIAAMEILSKILPPMKDEKWHVKLNTMIDKIKEEATPEDASAKGIVFAKLKMFVQRVDLSAKGDNPKDRHLLLNGQPVVQDHEQSGKAVFFRGVDFVDYLRRNRAEELKGPNLWDAMRKFGVGHMKMRIGHGASSVWYLPLDHKDEIHLETPEVESEF
ncbi:MAG: hypothetical protein KUG64_11120 [Cycloclasticus sp.]|nr:hypothetical protein [Cycloclasticus sp.]